MDRYNLTKPQKKICRELIDIALQRECGKFLESLSKAMTKNKKDEKSPYDSYIDVYKRVHNFDNKIARYFDDITGSKYFMTVFNLYMRKILTDKDLEIMDEEMYTEVMNMKTLF